MEWRLRRCCRCCAGPPLRGQTPLPLGQDPPPFQAGTPYQGWHNIVAGQYHVITWWMEMALGLDADEAYLLLITGAFVQFFLVQRKVVYTFDWNTFFWPSERSAGSGHGSRFVVVLLVRSVSPWKLYVWLQRNRSLKWIFSAPEFLGSTLIRRSRWLGETQPETRPVYFARTLCHFNPVFWAANLAANIKTVDSLSTKFT